METKSSHVLVGGVVIFLTIALFAFVLWLSRIDTKEQSEFDIFFKSVSGLAVGSQVAFSGVPVGSVTEIRLLPNTPEFVRVRIAIDPEVPILEGTTAAVEGVGFTGVSIIQLDGAIKGAPPITEPGPYGVPVIPTRPGAFGQLLSSAPQLLERVSMLSLRLSEVLDERNQQSIAGILKNTDRITGALANRSDEIAATLVEARSTLREASLAIDDFARLANSTARLLDEEGRPLVADLRTTVQRADRTLAAVEALTAEARPGVTTLTSQTLPEVNQLVHDLRNVTNSLGAVAAKLDEDPAGAMLGGRRLPDYDPTEQPQPAQ